MKKLLFLFFILISTNCFAAQYVIQIVDATGRLIKAYEVTEDYPIREEVPTGRTQVILTETVEYDAICAQYDSNENTVFVYNEISEEITW